MSAVATLPGFLRSCGGGSREARQEMAAMLIAEATGSVEK